MINILLADDSETSILMLRAICESEPDMRVIAQAKNGKEAVKLTRVLKPDLITMDIHMPVVDGLEATRLIMREHPTPIVVISADDESFDNVFRALDAGALSVLHKPANFNSPAFDAQRRHIIDTLRCMAGVKVIKRHHFSSKQAKPKGLLENPYHSYDVVAIGASVGGPQALKIILSKLSADYPVPILVVQHMLQGFINGFVKWLGDHVALKVQEAENNVLLKKGVVYIAPDNYHLEIDRTSEGLISRLVSKPPVSGFCPSISVMLRSIAKSCKKNAVGILLTGMGDDGVEGLMELKQAKGHTLVQDEESSVVFGMANVALLLGSVDKIVKLDQMAHYLNEIVAKNNK